MLADIHTKVNKRMTLRNNYSSLVDTPQCITKLEKRIKRKSNRERGQREIEK